MPCLRFRALRGMSAHLVAVRKDGFVARSRGLGRARALAAEVAKSGSYVIAAAARRKASRRS
jgi:hypothetical protein